MGQSVNNHLVGLSVFVFLLFFCFLIGVSILFSPRSLRSTTQKYLLIQRKKVFLIVIFFLATKKYFLRAHGKKKNLCQEKKMRQEKSNSLL